VFTVDTPSNPAYTHTLTLCGCHPLSPFRGDGYDTPHHLAPRHPCPQLTHATARCRGAATGESPIHRREEAAQRLGVQLDILAVRGPEDFDSGFEAASRARAEALIALPSPILNFHRQPLVDIAAKSRLPAMYQAREFVDAGGLMAYGPSFPELFRRAAIDVDKILKGAKPAHLPVGQPLKFELVINLKTAKALGLTVPSTLLFQATEVIR
jgi:ABC-type uncharacterized transport system substrate-binding protein